MSCGMDAVKPSSTPILVNQNLMSLDKEIENPKEYMRIVAISHTHMSGDAVCRQLLQFISSWKPLHCVAVKKVLRYLFGTQKMGIIFRLVQNFTISGYCVADGAKQDFLFI